MSATCIDGCGECCDPVMLPLTLREARTWLPVTDDDRADKAFILDALTPLSFAEGRRRAPHVGLGPLSATRGGPPMRPLFYACRHFDADTRRCTNYAGRPPMCRTYPWHEGHPDRRAALPLDCAYRADVA